jgi:hypothetical protein
MKQIAKISKRMTAENCDISFIVLLGHNSNIFRCWYTADGSSERAA